MWLKANLATERLPRRIASSTSSITRAPGAQRGDIYMADRKDMEIQACHFPWVPGMIYTSDWLSEKPVE